MKEPKLVTATQDELDEILLRARPALSDQRYRLLDGALATFVCVMLKLQNAKTSIKRFQRILFGHRTEHTRNVLELAAQTGGSDAMDAESVPDLPGVVPVSSGELMRGVNSSMDQHLTHALRLRIHKVTDLPRKLRG